MTADTVFIKQHAITNITVTIDRRRYEQSTAKKCIFLLKTELFGLSLPITWHQAQCLVYTTWVWIPLNKALILITHNDKVGVLLE